MDKKLLQNLFSPFRQMVYQEFFGNFRRHTPPCEIVIKIETPFHHKSNYSFFLFGRPWNRIQVGKVFPHGCRLQIFDICGHIEFYWRKNKT